MSRQKKKTTGAASLETPFTEAHKLEELWNAHLEAPEPLEKICPFSKGDLAFMISNLEKRVEACEEILSKRPV